MDRWFSASERSPTMRWVPLPYTEGIATHSPLRRSTTVPLMLGVLSTAVRTVISFLIAAQRVCQIARIPRELRRDFIVRQVLRLSRRPMREQTGQAAL